MGRNVCTLYLQTNAFYGLPNLEQQFAAASPDPEEQEKIRGWGKLRGYIPSFEPQKARLVGYTFSPGRYSYCCCTAHHTVHIPKELPKGIHFQFRDTHLNLRTHRSVCGTLFDPVHMLRPLGSHFGLRAQAFSPGTYEPVQLRGTSFSLVAQLGPNLITAAKEWNSITH